MSAGILEAAFGPEGLSRHVPISVRGLFRGAENPSEAARSGLESPQDSRHRNWGCEKGDLPYSPNTHTCVSALPRLASLLMALKGRVRARPGPRLSRGGFAFCGEALAYQRV
jgi:hypothetical protein